MLNTTTTLQQLIQQQTTTTTKQYTNYNSKNSLLSSNVLNKQCNTMLLQLKNCFTFSLHVSKLYLVITMYFSNTKQYSYYVLNTTTLQVNVFTSIKLAKQYVTQQLQQQTQQTTTTTKQTVTK